MDESFDEVNVSPSKAEDLVFPHPRIERDDQSGPELFARFDVPEQDHDAPAFRAVAGCPNPVHG